MMRVFLLVLVCTFMVPLWADTWIVEGQQPSIPPEIEWVTEPANTTLATFHVIESAAVGGPVSFHVYLPPAYNLQPQRRFPVLYWLHGSGAGIMGIPGVSNFFHGAIVRGDIPPMIIVYPNGLHFGMWTDSKDGSTPVESMVMEDLLPHIDANFRTIASREGRLVEGFSMGGYGAGRLGLKYHHLFRGFSMMGAGPLHLDFLADDPDNLLVPLQRRIEIFDQVWGGDPDLYLAQHPWTIAESVADDLPEDIAIRLIIGTEDNLLQNNRIFHAHLDELGIDHEYLEITGIDHTPLQLLLNIGPGNWAFYQAAFGKHE